MFVDNRYRNASILQVGMALLARTMPMKDEHALVAVAIKEARYAATQTVVARECRWDVHRYLVRLIR